MIRPPANRKRDLGPILAIAAAAIAGVAIVIGFIIVGGPGHARDQRFDEMTDGRIHTLVAAVQCAFESSGLPPLTFDQAKATRPVKDSPDYGAESCGGWPGGSDFAVGANDKPAAPDAITYSVTGSTRVKVCGNFRLARSSDSVVVVTEHNSYYPQLDAPHPAGIYCYDIELLKSSDRPPVPVVPDAFNIKP